MDSDIYNHIDEYKNNNNDSTTDDTDNEYDKDNINGNNDENDVIITIHLRRLCLKRCPTSRDDHPFPIHLSYAFLTMITPQMETFVVLLAICEGNSLVTGEFPA